VTNTNRVTRTISLTVSCGTISSTRSSRTSAARRARATTGPGVEERLRNSSLRGSGSKAQKSRDSSEHDSSGARRGEAGVNGTRKDRSPRRQRDSAYHRTAAATVNYESTPSGDIPHDSCVQQWRHVTQCDSASHRVAAATVTRVSRQVVTAVTRHTIFV
jgi:hypothetical protein